LNLRFQMATGQLDNYSRLSAAKRNVARVLTVLRDREIALAEGRDAGPVFVEQPVRPPRRRAETIEEDATDEIDDDVVDVDVVDVDPVDVEEDESSAEADADEEDE
jgi:hypothetical protein